MSSGNNDGTQAGADRDRAIQDRKERAALSDTYKRISDSIRLQNSSSKS